jgi:hypothetical protein
MASGPGKVRADYRRLVAESQHIRYFAAGSRPRRALSLVPALLI